MPDDAALLRYVNGASHPRIDFRYTTLYRGDIPHVKGALYMTRIPIVRNLAAALARSHNYDLEDLSIVVDGEDRYLMNGTPNLEHTISTRVKMEFERVYGMPFARTPEVVFQSKADQRYPGVNKADRLAYMLLFEAIKRGLGSMLENHKNRHVPVSAEEIRAIRQFHVIDHSVLEEDNARQTRHGT